MPRRGNVFRQVDVMRALKAAMAAGMKIERVELSSDRIVLIAPSTIESANEFDEWMARKHANQS